jgi:hypothetical protein
MKRRHWLVQILVLLYEDFTNRVASQGSQASKKAELAKKAGGLRADRVFQKGLVVVLICTDSIRRLLHQHGTTST